MLNGKKDSSLILKYVGGKKTHQLDSTPLSSTGVSTTKWLAKRGYVLGDDSNIPKNCKNSWDIREDSCTLPASVFSKNTKGRFLSSKACAYWKCILDVDKHPLALNEIISCL